MSKRKPWDHQQALSEDRLKFVAQLMLRARSGVLTLHDPESGDDSWSLGCRAYSWCRHQIIQAANSGNYPWLVVSDPGMQFAFRIGDVSVRFYRGLPEQPNSRTLQRSYDELRQTQLRFSDNTDEELMWRFALETDVFGEIVQITVVGFNKIDEPICQWAIPLNEIKPTLTNIDDLRPEGVDLPPPEVRLPLENPNSSAL